MGTLHSRRRLHTRMPILTPICRISTHTHPKKHTQRTNRKSSQSPKNRSTRRRRSRRTSHHNGIRRRHKLLTSNRRRPLLPPKVRTLWNSTGCNHEHRQDKNHDLHIRTLNTRRTHKRKPNRKLQPQNSHQHILNKQHPNARRS